jgi:hypothetical protein
MKRERTTLRRSVREYFAEIGSRGGSSGRRDLTRQQAKVMVAIREANRAAKKKGKPPPKMSRQYREILRQSL